MKNIVFYLSFTLFFIPYTFGQTTGELYNLVRSETIEEKEAALAFIEDAINRGDTGTEIVQALEYLSMEGIGRNIIRDSTNGRINNFYGIRQQSAQYLGLIGTEEAYNLLIKILKSEDEPMVIQEAIKSLGDIGFYGNGESMDAIAYAVSYFRYSDLVAFRGIEAFGNIARKNNVYSHPEALNTLSRIAQSYNYIWAIINRAKEELDFWLSQQK